MIRGLVKLKNQKMDIWGLANSVFFLLFDFLTCHASVKLHTVLNKKTQQILLQFWCHQWTLSLSTGLQRDVVGVK